MEELWKVTERLIKWVKLLAVHYTGSPLRILVAGVRCKSLQDNNLKKAPVGLKIKNSHRLLNIGYRFLCSKRRILSSLCLINTLRVSFTKLNESNTNYNVSNLETDLALPGVTNGLREHSRACEHCDFFASTSKDKKICLASSEQFREYNSRAASTSYIFRLQQSIWKSFSLK